MKNTNSLVLGLATAALAAGWSLREAQFAEAQEKRLASTLVQPAEVPLEAMSYKGEPTGKAQVYSPARP